MTATRKKWHLHLECDEHYFKFVLTLWLIISGVAAIADAAPLPPPGCGQFCGTITLIKDPSVGIPFSEPESALGPPWVSYQLDLHTPAFPVFAVDFVINGQLHQSWSDANGDGIFEPSANDTNTIAGDSHLLAPSNAGFGFGPMENNSGNGSPLADTPVHDYGVGAFLAGAWFNPNPSSFTNLAYIVVPKGSPLDIKVLFLDDRDRSPIPKLTTSDFIRIPEPATMTLAACGFAVTSFVVARRRR